MILLLSLMLLVIVLFCMLLKPHENKYFKELFEGFRINSLAQLHNFVFLVRRFLVVLVIVAMRSTDVMPRLSVYAFLQFVSLTYTVMVRPHDQRCSNAIEIINEVSYFTVIVLILFIQKFDSSVANEVLNNSIISNTAVVLVISIATFICQTIKFYRAKKRERKIQPNTQPKTQPMTPSKIKPKMTKVKVQSSQRITIFDLHLNSSHTNSPNQSIKDNTIDTARNSANLGEISTERKLVSWRADRPNRVAKPYRVARPYRADKPCRVTKKSKFSQNIEPQIMKEDEISLEDSLT